MIKRGGRRDFINECCLVGYIPLRHGHGRELPNAATCMTCDDDVPSGWVECFCLREGVEEVASL